MTSTDESRARRLVRERRTGRENASLDIDGTALAFMKRRFESIGWRLVSESAFLFDSAALTPKVPVRPSRLMPSPSSGGRSVLESDGSSSNRRARERSAWLTKHIDGFAILSTTFGAKMTVEARERRASFRERRASFQERRPWFRERRSWFENGASGFPTAPLTLPSREPGV